MIIEYISEGCTGRVLVTMNAEEMNGCGVSFGDMSLADGPTRALLDRLVSLVTRMGLRSEGEQVRVECAPSGEGGCALLISPVTATEYIFDSGDDIISAYTAGVLPEGTVRRVGERWILTGTAPAHPRQRRILSEYCVPAEQ